MSFSQLKNYLTEELNEDNINNMVQSTNAQIAAQTEHKTNYAQLLTDMRAVDVTPPAPEE